MVTDNTGKAVDFEIYEGESSATGTKIDVPEFASSYTAGQDAVMDVTINGKNFSDFTRASNSFEIDGLTINVSLAQPAKLNLAVGPGLGGGELELVGELGVAHLHSGAHPEPGRQRCGGAGIPERGLQLHQSGQEAV